MDSIKEGEIILEKGIHAIRIEKLGQSEKILEYSFDIVNHGEVKIEDLSWMFKNFYFLAGLMLITPLLIVIYWNRKSIFRNNKKREIEFHEIQVLDGLKERYSREYEEKYRQGKWIVKLYAEAMTPNSPKWMQGSKELIQTDSEEEIIQGISEHIFESLVEEDRMIIWGSGGTLRTIGKMLNFNLTTLGIDITVGKSQIATDVNEQQITQQIQSHSGIISLLLSPMGGQGFLIGRGNLQLSPKVIRMIGIENIIGIVTPSKLLSVRKLRIDSGDDELDSEFSELKYMKVIQGYRTTRILPLEVT